VRRPAAVAVVAALILIIVALALSSVRLDSATMDEPAHMAGGMVKLLHGRLDFFRDNPPLMNAISAAPLIMTGHRLRPGWTPDTDHWVLGRVILYRSGYDADRLLFLARLPTVALFALLSLLVYAFVARETASRAWGIAAMALTGFCPNLMAHGRLATTDIAATTFMFAAGILLLRMIERPTALLAIGLGAASACAILSKTSAIFLGPYFIVVIVLAFLMKKVTAPRRFAAMFGLAIVAAIVVAEVVILGLASDSYLRENFPDLPRIAVPFAELLANLQAIRTWLVRGHKLPQFLLGEFSFGSWPHYYLVAMLLKTTIPALLLIVAGIVAGIRARKLSVLSSLLFAVMFLIVASTSALAVGVRYVLPVYPFLYAAAIIALAGSVKNARLAAPVVIALLSWHAAENALAYPGYIAYFNEITGGNKNADRFLIDSNLDWGQDLRRLDRWCAENGAKEMTIHYFGGGDVERGLPAVAKVNIRYGPGPGLLPEGWFALSRHFYRLSFFPAVSPVDYDSYLEASGARYVGTVGDTILVYRVDRE
jgi:hypothetical protein